jgi:hypothetical protein
MPAQFLFTAPPLLYIPPALREANIVAYDFVAEFNTIILERKTFKPPDIQIFIVEVNS